MARTQQQQRPGRAAQAPSAPEAAAAGEDLTRAASGNIIESSELTPTTATQADRHALISEAAYRRAEQRGFEPGRELEDWLAAEREIDEREGAGGIG